MTEVIDTASTRVEPDPNCIDGVAKSGSVESFTECNTTGLNTRGKRWSRAVDTGSICVDVAKGSEGRTVTPQLRMLGASLCSTDLCGLWEAKRGADTHSFCALGAIAEGVLACALSDACARTVVGSGVDLAVDPNSQQGKEEKQQPHDSLKGVSYNGYTGPSLKQSCGCSCCFFFSRCWAWPMHPFPALLGLVCLQPTTGLEHPSR